MLPCANVPTDKTSGVGMLSPRAGPSVYRQATRSARPAQGHGSPTGDAGLETDMNMIGRRLVVAEVVGFALVGPYLARFTVQANRYYVHWRRGDVLGMLLIATVLAMLLFVCDAAARRMKHHIAKRIRDGAFAFLVGLGLAANLYQHSYVNDLPPAGAWLWAMPIILAVVAVMWHQTARVTAALCLIVSPFIVLMPARMLCYPTFAVGVEPLPVAGSATSSASPEVQPDIYLFIFDEWSYERTFDMAGRANPEFVNLAELGSRCDVYTDAHSPATHTKDSIPRLLSETNLKFTRRRGIPGFRTEEGTWVPVDEMRGLFDRARARSMRTFVVGWYHPYRRLFDERVEFTHSICQYDYFGSSFSGRAAYHLIGVTRRWVPPLAVFRYPWKRYEERVYAQTQAPRTDEIHRLAKHIIRFVPEPTFAVFHYPVPHRPFVFDGAGVRDTPIYDERSEEGYEGNLAYTDVLVGELIETLQRRGKFDRSCLILTSDHAWRVDPALPQDPSNEELTHVPLMIKRPWQHAARSIPERFATMTLGEAVFDTAVGRQARRPSLRRPEHSP